MGPTKLRSFVEPCPVPAQRIDVGGLGMNYVVAGVGRPIVFLHGLGWDHTLWGRQIERLRDRYRVIAADTRGHGETDKPAGPYTVAQFVADWAALMDKLGVSSALFVGFSLGGMIAQQLALRRPDLVGALVLVNTTCRVPSSGREHMGERLAAMQAGGARAAAEVAARSVFSEAWRNEHPEQLADFIDWRAGHDQVALREVMRAASELDIADELCNIKVQTRVVTALGDTLMPPQSQALIAERLAGADEVHIPDAGHMVSIEKAHQFDAALDDFLTRHWTPLAPTR
jgi:3-oxoadipate enol-lactonase